MNRLKDADGNNTPPIADVGPHTTFYSPYWQPEKGPKLTRLKGVASIESSFALGEVKRSHVLPIK